MSLINMKQAMQAEALRGQGTVEDAEERRKQFNEQQKQAERASTMGAVGTGAGIGASVGGPVGALIGAGIGLIGSALF